MRCPISHTISSIILKRNPIDNSDIIPEWKTARLFVPRPTNRNLWQTTWTGFIGIIAFRCFQCLCFPRWSFLIPNPTVKKCSDWTRRFSSRLCSVNYPVWVWKLWYWCRRNRYESIWFSNIQPSTSHTDRKSSKNRHSPDDRWAAQRCSRIPWEPNVECIRCQKLHQRRPSCLHQLQPDLRLIILLWRLSC